MSRDASTVFVVDDDPSVRRGLERLLRAAGFGVEAFESARDFLARLPIDQTGCVIVDLQMPGVTGLELQRQISEEGLFLPVLFLTAHGDVPTSVEAMKKGALDFLLKPVDEELLLAAVRQAVARHGTDLARQRKRARVQVRLRRLSRREREVLGHVIRGRLNKQIAADLGIAEKTVKVHRSRLMAKMEVGSVAELVHACESIGIEAHLTRDDDASSTRQLA